ncbi:hypothetical protein WUBG_09335, partial [Wuchereria bancrofti]
HFQKKGGYSLLFFLASSIFECVEGELPEAEMSTLDDLKIRIVAVIGSEKNGCTANNLYQIYKYFF